MKKKITMVDIAEMCNVSVATVSYVLNNKEGSRISEQTKQKILQIANLYSYRSNPYARSLATGEMHNILFFCNSNVFSLHKAEILDFINQLAAYLRPYKYNIIISSNNLIAKYNYVDAIIVYRTNTDTFKQLGDLNFIPLIAVDCSINDNLFFEINNSFAQINNDNNTLYLSFPYGDNTIENKLLSKGNVKFVDSVEDIHEIINNHQQHNICCLNIELSSYLSSIKIKHTFIELNTQSKFEAIIDAIQFSINRTDVDKHQYIID